MSCVAIDVVRVADISAAELRQLLQRFDLQFEIEPDGQKISASFWGDDEAGIRGMTVFSRLDTPLHSVLHEASHVICMTSSRRSDLECDAGGDDLEEAAVCYMQVVLADSFEAVGRERLMRDMDVWGYSFRLGSTREWFYRDADDAREFLLNHRLLNASGEPTFTLRE